MTIIYRSIPPTSQDFSNLLLAALNIASGRLFWWQEPKNLSTFFESLEDLERKKAGLIGRSPELRIRWPNAVLDDAILDRAISLLCMMPEPYERQEESVPLSHYMTGIALLAKSDVFLQFEIQSYGAFVQSVDSALDLYRPTLHLDLQPKDIASLLTSLDNNDRFKIKHTATGERLAARAVKVRETRRLLSTRRPYYISKYAPSFNIRVDPGLSTRKPRRQNLMGFRTLARSLHWSSGHRWCEASSHAAGRNS